MTLSQTTTASPDTPPGRGAWATLGAQALPEGGADAQTERYRFGPARLPDGRTRFRLWAPDAANQGEAPRLEIQDLGPVPMVEVEPGWFEAVAACCNGCRYWFRLGDGTTVPDPASRAQADDVHGASMVIDASGYEWCHPYWKGRPWHEAIVYEMHVGLFGGYAGAMRELPRLAALGFTAVELMPLAEFPGGRNWGYDGVLPFAPESSYGTPDQLRALVDSAHGLGMMVMLDVVYNHFGPEGNYLPTYASAFFRDDVPTPWGPAIDFRRPEVRTFFAENAEYWLDAFRFDGLRLDAVHAIVDEGWLPELAQRLRTRFAERQVHLVLENDHNDAQLLAGGYDAQWNDDAHHALHVALTGEDAGYYADYANPLPSGDSAAPAEGASDGRALVGGARGRPAMRHLARILAEGFAYQGEVSAFRTAAEESGGQPVRRGQPSASLPPTAFMLFLQNHDQTGNRAFGERLTQLARPQAIRAAVTMQLLCPHIPMVFMGEESGADTPFLYFTSHPPELAQAVREGRRREFGAMPAFQDADQAARIPDPNDPATFDASRPTIDPDNAWARLYRTMITVRRRELLPRLPGTRAIGVELLGDAALKATWQLGDGTLLTLWVNLGDTPVRRSSPVEGDLLAESEDGAAQELAAGTLLPAVTVACLHESTGGRKV